MRPNPGCKVQQLFVLCFETWLKNPETPIIPEMSGVLLAQREAVHHAAEEQGQIGWIQGFRGYLSKHWAQAVALNLDLDEKSPSKWKEIGDTWARKAILQLWKYVDKMWEHRNDKLHNTKSDTCHKMKVAAVDLEMKLCIAGWER